MPQQFGFAIEVKQLESLSTALLKQQSWEFQDIQVKKNMMLKKFIKTEKFIVGWC